MSIVKLQHFLNEAAINRHSGRANC